jgi:hypothetical protein
MEKVQIENRWGKVVMLPANEKRTRIPRKKKKIKRSKEKREI